MRRPVALLLNQLAAVEFSFGLLGLFQRNRLRGFVVAVAAAAVFGTVQAAVAVGFGRRRRVEGRHAAAEVVEAVLAGRRRGTGRGVAGFTVGRTAS